jgi:hypothetical protein
MAWTWNSTGHPLHSRAHCHTTSIQFQRFSDSVGLNYLFSSRAASLRWSYRSWTLECIAVDRANTCRVKLGDWPGGHGVILGHR